MDDKLTRPSADAEGRMLVHDEFDGHVTLLPVSDGDDAVGGRRFRAVVAQTDKINLNRRLYPRTVMEGCLGSINDECSDGSMLGGNGHDGLMSPAKPSETVIVWESAMLKRDDMLMVGTLIENSIGRDIATNWQAGVAAKFSLSGWASTKTMEDANKKPYDEIQSDYKLAGVDLVNRGAAVTGIISTKDSEVDMTVENSEEVKAMETETKEEVVAPTVEQLDGVGNAYTGWNPAGKGVITAKADEAEKYWSPAAGHEGDRPDTVDGVYRGMMEGVENTGVQSFDNPAFVWKTMLDNQLRTFPETFVAQTKQGWREAATTSTALGTAIKVALPLQRAIFPMLLPMELAGIQPMSGPQGVVFSLNYQYADGGVTDGSDFDDSAAFDSTYADHSEGVEKAQISFDIEGTNITATEKSVYWSITSVTMQDAQALHGIDILQDAIRAGAGEIARERNRSFIELMRAGATASTRTFGTTVPATGWDEQSDWDTRGLSQYLALCCADIAEARYSPGSWMIARPTVVARLSGLGSWVSDGNTADSQFGIGTQREGVFDGRLTVYSTSWFNNNLCLFGKKPNRWDDADSCYCPYLTYVSPLESDASHNTLDQSVSERSAQVLLHGSGYSTLTLADEVGTSPFA